MFTGFKLLDSFVIYNYGLIGDVNVQVFIRESNYLLRTVTTPDVYDPIHLAAEDHNRSFQEGDIIDRFCDDTTKITVKALNDSPFAEVEIETSSSYCGFNGGGSGGGTCTLSISNVELVSPHTVEIIPEGFAVDDVLEYSLGGTPWQDDSVFENLDAGNYTAYVRDGNGCQGSKAFVVPADGQVLLKINSIDTVPEHNEFAADGSATINAVSSTGPLEYSLNNVSWQSSNVFNNLAPGIYTAYVNDTITTKQLSFIIESYNNFIFEMPDVEASPDNNSKWLAVHNPLIFKFRRTDYDIIGIVGFPNDTDLNKKPSLILTQVPAGLEVGGFIYVRSEKYNGLYKVLNFSGNNVTLDTKWIISVNKTGHIITNSKPNYRVELKVLTGIGPEKDITIGAFTADSSGLIFCQLQSKLKNLVNNKNEFSYNQINWRDVNAAGSFELYYREVWDDHLNEEWKLIPNAYYFTNSAKQIGDKFGSNMAEYVLFPTSPPTSNKARFMTIFKEPTYFIGYPFDLSFIYSEKIVGYQLNRSEVLLDINRNPIGSTGYTMMLNQDDSLLLNEDNKLLLIEEGRDGFVPLSQALGIHRLMISDQIVGNTYFKEISLVYEDLDQIIRITENKVVKINNDCRVNPVYLTWINTLGGWDYWLFERTQKVNLGTGNVKTFDVYIQDLADASATTETITKDAADKVTVGASVDLDDFKAIRGVIYSPKVLLLTGQTPVKWITVQVEQTSLSYETKDSQADIEFSIILPSINIQSN